VFFTAAPIRPRVFEPSAKRRKKAPAPYGLNPKTSGQVALTDRNSRCADGIQSAEEHGADPRWERHRDGLPAKDLLPLDDVLGCLKDPHQLMPGPYN
jgi:hypothetical protein